MVRMFVRHRVQDYAIWRPYYDAAEAMRRTKGVRGSGVSRTIGKPNEITVWHAFDSAEQAKAFVGPAERRAVMASAGVAEAPAIWVTGGGLTARLPDPHALLVVRVEPAPALLSQPASSDQISQQGRRTVLVVAHRLVEDVGDREHGVEADEVAQLEGAHRNGLGQDERLHRCPPREPTPS